MAALHVLAEAVRGKLGPVEISAVAPRSKRVLDEEDRGRSDHGPIIEGDAAGGRVDLSAIDFGEARQAVSPAQPRTATEALREKPKRRLRNKLSGTESPPCAVCREIEKLVEQYNLGKLDVEAFFEALKVLNA